MSSRVVRAAVMASLLVVGVVAMPGLAPAAHAQSDFATGGSATGYDISWPQCGGPYPTNAAFGIVGVNGGIVFSPNPCLADELVWAGGAAAEFYANTGNPGPVLSTHWPSGQVSPKYCDPHDLDTIECAFDYGYNAAIDSFANAIAAYQTLGLAGSPAGNPWWLDVETSNSWRSDVSLNVAALDGAVQYLRSAGVRSIGFYSTLQQWNVITGGGTAFAAYRSWVAGYADAQSAAAGCGGTGFTGGGVGLVQFPSGGFDGDVRCVADGAVLTSIVVSPATASVEVGTPQQFSATAYDQANQPLDPQPAVTWSVSGGGAISGSGLFTAGSTAGGPFTVTATIGTVSGTATVTTTAAPGFAISVSPASVTVKRGQAATYQVTVTPSNGFTASVSLNVKGLPSGSKVTFSANPADTGATLTIQTSKSARVGTFPLTISGTYAAVTHTATAGLTVTK